jgi:hypothetical protein
MEKKNLNLFHTKLNIPMEQLATEREMQTNWKKPQISSKLELLSREFQSNREMKSPTIHCWDIAQFESKRKKKA